MRLANGLLVLVMAFGCAGCGEKIGTCLGSGGTVGGAKLVATCQVNQSSKQCETDKLEKKQFFAETSQQGLSHCRSLGYTSLMYGTNRKTMELIRITRQGDLERVLSEGHMVTYTTP